MVDVRAAVNWLRAGRVVAYPTETFYGLAVDPQSAAAVRLLFEIKGRDARSAVPLIAASVDQVQQWCGPLGEPGTRLAARFWPGPLALIVDAPKATAVEVHGGANSVAIRVPAHPLAQALCAAWGGPLSATSANRSGEAPACSVEELGALAADQRVLVVDGGRTTGGLPSTIVDARGPQPLLVRNGVVPWERVLDFLKE